MKALRIIAMHDRTRAAQTRGVLPACGRAVHVHTGTRA